MQDQPVVRVEQELGRDHLDQQILHRTHILARRQTGAVGDAEDVRVHRHHRLAEGRVEHDIGSLAADTGQRLECSTITRHLAAVLFHQHRAGRNHVLRFRVVQADGGDVLLQAVFTERKDRLRGIGDREQFARGLVDADIRGLRRQRDRHQQLERRAVLQFGLGVRVEFAQAREHFDHVGLGHARGACGGFLHRGHQDVRPAALALARARIAAAAEGRAGFWISGVGGGARRASRSAARRASRCWRWR
ncbi:hypothetical protein D3C71_1192940 [compost metagenome]